MIVYSWSKVKVLRGYEEIPVNYIFTNGIKKKCSLKRSFKFIRANLWEFFNFYNLTQKILRFFAMLIQGGHTKHNDTEYWDNCLDGSWGAEWYKVHWGLWCLQSGYNTTILGCWHLKLIFIEMCHNFRVGGKN